MHATPVEDIVKEAKFRILKNNQDGLMIRIINEGSLIKARNLIESFKRVMEESGYVVEDFDVPQFRKEYLIKEINKYSKSKPKKYFVLFDAIEEFKNIGNFYVIYIDRYLGY